MSINKTKDPRTKKEITLVEGPITGIFLNELKTIKTYANDWTPTHSVNLLVDGTKIGLGLTDKEKVSAKDADESWHDLEKGMEVSVLVTEGDYQGKPQYNAMPKDVLVVNASVPESKQSSAPASGKAAYTKRDTSGVSTGHAINVAFNVLEGEAVDNPDGVVELAKKAHDLTVKLKAEYTEKNPDMSEYDLGAMVGQSILSASRITDFDSIEAVARETLESIVPAVSAYVKGNDKPVPEKKAVAKKAAPKKTAAKKGNAEVPQEPDEFLTDTVGNASPDFDDSDIPF